MDQRNACLVLKTSDLTPGQTNNNGVCDASRQNMTWYNINLRTVLGDLYDKFDYFNLSLYFISTDTQCTITQAADKCVYMKIGGLPFSNQTYNVSNKANGTLCTMATFAFQNSGASVQQNFYGSGFMTFAKNQELVNINIQYTRIQDENPYSGAGNFSYPNTTFIFHIFGVPKEDNHSTRIQLLN